MTAINSNRAIRGPVTAVPVVAGKGVRLMADTENNRWVVEADETVLWEDVNGANSATLSESRENFEKIVLICKDDNSRNTVLTIMSDATEAGNTFAINVTTDIDLTYRFISCVVTSATTLQIYGAQVSYKVSTKAVNWMSGPSSAASYAKVFKVVGVNRIASN
jgi:hypothetical protein